MIQHRLTRRQLAAMWMKATGRYTGKYVYATQEMMRPLVVDTSGVTTVGKMSPMRNVEVKILSVKSPSKRLKAERTPKVEVKPKIEEKKWSTAGMSMLAAAEKAAAERKARAGETKQAFETRKLEAGMRPVKTVKETQVDEAAFQRKREKERLKEEQRMAKGTMRERLRRALGGAREQVAERGAETRIQRNVAEAERRRYASLAPDEQAREAAAKRIQRHQQLRQVHMTDEFGALGRIESLEPRKKYLDLKLKEKGREFRETTGGQEAHLFFKYAHEPRDIYRITKRPDQLLDFDRKVQESLPYTSSYLSNLDAALRVGRSHLRTGDWEDANLYFGTKKDILDQLT